MENLDQANLELDKLRKFVDTLQADLEEAVQEAEVSKRRRDWAFSERDKIVLERESIRTLCDRYNSPLTTSRIVRIDSLSLLTGLVQVET